MDKDPTRLNDGNNSEYKKDKTKKISNTFIDFAKIFKNSFKSKAKYENVERCPSYSSVNCFFKASCCKKPFCCNHCHNSKEINNSPTINPANKKCDVKITNHKLDKMDLKVICRSCNKIQDLSKKCTNQSCKKKFAEYFCSKCIVYSNSNTFHCEKCGICRLGNNSDYFHCDICNTCINNTLKNNCDSPNISICNKKHKHIENTLKTFCPICAEYMFDKRKHVVLMKCGHSIHTECLNNYKKFYISCPVCKKSLGDNKIIKEKISYLKDKFLGKDSKELDKVFVLRYSESTDLPERNYNFLNGKIDIKCHDCYEMSEVIDMKIFNECKSCGSINTIKK